MLKVITQNTCFPHPEYFFAKFNLYSWVFLPGHPKSNKQMPLVESFVKQTFKSRFWSDLLWKLWKHIWSLEIIGLLFDLFRENYLELSGHLGTGWTAKFKPCLRRSPRIYLDCSMCFLSKNSPDFAKALRIASFMVPPASLRIYRNSTLRYATQWVHLLDLPIAISLSFDYRPPENACEVIFQVCLSLSKWIRINYDVACPMNFRKYPYDTQVCRIKYESCKLNSSSWQSILTSNILIVLIS